ncbi:MAG: general secretion pathway protein GspK [Candidatus Omnitrophica bacterium]|nr:general secretion pathway protein GspK [Candidatus Omnitrophota bacterium]
MVSILTVVAILGVSFVFSMYLETHAYRQFSATVRARYVAEAGISHGRAVLAEDRAASSLDNLQELWVTALAGAEADVDGDGQAESKWNLLASADEAVAGRYAVLIQDEAGKVHINTALADPHASGVDAASLTLALSRAGVANAGAVAAAVEAARYGPDGQPGLALIDDDRDGALDEPDEYQALALRGDDRRFETVEELLGLGGLDAAGLRKLSDAATTYSWDANVTMQGAARFDLNTAIADELLAVLLDTGVDNPWQVAANMADYADPDLAISRVSKMTVHYTVPNQGPQGAWGWQAEPVAHYETTTPGETLIWQLSVPSGTFRVLVHGLPGVLVGDVEIQGERKAGVVSGESFGTLQLSGAITVTVTGAAAQGTRCAFQGIELVVPDDTPGYARVPIRGIEAVRVNEVMVAPTKELPITSAVFDSQVSEWACPVGSSNCSNSGTGQGRWTWTDPTVPPGSYYVRVFGTEAGQTVGEARVGTTTTLLTHGGRHPATLTVGDDHKIILAIGKTAADGTYFFQKAILSLEPDAEYVELINLSEEEIDVSGWVIEGEATHGRQGRFPEGTVVPSRGLMVAAVDAEDAQGGVAGNQISARAAWQVPDAVPIAQLEFPGGEVTPDMDWLGVDVGGESPTLILRAGEWVVDEVELPLPLPTSSGFQSLEKGDPSEIHDEDADGLDEAWYPALQLYTPGAPNNNEGLQELQDLQLVTHDPATDVAVVNRALSSVGELAGLPTGTAWQTLTSQDLAKMADRFTVEGIRLEPEGHVLEGSDSWHETLDGYETTFKGSIATWQWTDVPDGYYRLSLIGWSGEQLSVRWQEADGAYTEWIPSRWTDEQGRIVVGQAAVGVGGAPARTLTLQARCDSTSGVCHVNHLWLDPRPILVGMINVNTASRDVLLALPGMTETAVDRVIAGRPYGNQDGRWRGIGDLLMGSVLGETEADRLERFRQIAHLLTVRSNVFRVMSLGESLQADQPVGIQRIQAVIQR